MAEHIQVHPGDALPLVPMSFLYLLLATAALLGGGLFLVAAAEVVRVTALSLFGLLWYEGRTWPFLALLAVPSVLLVGIVLVFAG